MGRKAQPKTEPKTPEAEPSTAIERSIHRLDAVLTTCNTDTLALLPMLEQAVSLAEGIRQIKAVLTDEVMTRVFMPLQGTPLGFLHDRAKAEKGPKEYSIAEVRECMVEAMINGFRPVGNEINIISGRVYGAKAGYRRKVVEFPGLTDLRLTPGVPQSVGEKGALVPFRATWRLDGQPMELVRDVTKGADGHSRDTRIAVRVNRLMGADAIIGKAERKVLRAIHDLISNVTLSKVTLTIEDGETDAIDVPGEVVEPPPVPGTQDGRRMKLGKDREPAPQPEPPKSQPKGDAAPSRPAHGDTTDVDGYGPVIT